MLSAHKCSKSWSPSSLLLSYRLHKNLTQPGFVTNLHSILFFEKIVSMNRLSLCFVTLIFAPVALAGLDMRVETTTLSRIRQPSQISYPKARVQSTLVSSQPMIRTLAPYLRTKRSASPNNRRKKRDLFANFLQIGSKFLINLWFD